MPLSFKSKNSVVLTDLLLFYYTTMGVNYLKINIKVQNRVFRWFIPVVCDYNISVDKVGKSKHNKTILRYKESKDRQQVSAILL